MVEVDLFDDEFTNYRGVTILNRTPNSFIDAYDFDK